MNLKIEILNKMWIFAKRWCFEKLWKIFILGDQYSWIAKYRPVYVNTISKVESLVHFTLNTTYVNVTNSLLRKFVGKDDGPNQQTSITLEQVSIRKVLTSLEIWIPALCAHQNFIKKIKFLLKLLIRIEFQNRNLH